MDKAQHITDRTSTVAVILGILSVIPSNNLHNENCQVIIYLSQSIKAWLINSVNVI